jgi:hypothetical protein
MLNDLVHITDKLTVYMTVESYKKFNQTSYFKLIHESKTEDIDPNTNEPVHWARVFQVNWSYFTDKSALKYMT